jgi:hypothetical protein
VLDGGVGGAFCSYSSQAKICNANKTLEPIETPIYDSNLSMHIMGEPNCLGFLIFTIYFPANRRPKLILKIMS